MSEPTTHDRCHGGTAYGRCLRAESCDRYDAKPRRDAFYLHPQVPGPCVYYVPRRAAPVSPEGANGSHPNPSNPSATPERTP